MIVLILLLSDSNAVCVVYTCSHTLIVHLQSISPTSVNVTPGGRAEFHCRLLPGVKALLGWEINGQPLNESLGQSGGSKGGLSTLTISDIEHNRTIVSCIAILQNGTRLGKADAEILLQGK